RTQLSDRQSYDGWDKEKLDSNQQAKKKWKAMLAAYQAPALDRSIEQALVDFMEKRTARLTK
ncbi:MAG TPA: trimethylamine methyltransferase family protein, partial [Negativicutes bacterium]